MVCIVFVHHITVAESSHFGKEFPRNLTEFADVLNYNMMPSEFWALHFMEMCVSHPNMFLNLIFFSQLYVHTGTNFYSTFLELFFF